MYKKKGERTKIHQFIIPGADHPAATAAVLAEIIFLIYSLGLSLFFFLFFFDLSERLGLSSGHRLLKVGMPKRKK